MPLHTDVLHDKRCSFARHVAVYSHGKLQDEVKLPPGGLGWGLGVSFFGLLAF